MTRRVLDWLYRISELVAAGFIFLIFAIIVTQVCFGLTDRVAKILGVPAPGLSVPAYAEFAAFLLAGGIFMGLAGSLRAGAHVRVNMLLIAVPLPLRRLMEAACGALGFCVVAYFTWRAGIMTYESWLYGDMSFGLVAVPMWIPQSAMVLGLATLTLGLLDVTVSVLTRRVDPALLDSGVSGD